MTPRRRLNSSPTPAINIILDSGAYSAWRLKKPVNIAKYCDYLLANREWIGSYVCLDVINPGHPEEAARASFANLLYMRKRGLDPMPVFHVGEDISWLYKMLDLGCTYIWLSASSLVSRNKVDDWYSAIWSHLVTSDGLPVVKAHAFGEGREASLLQFPWFSADSTSWVYQSQRNGVAPMPDGRTVAFRNDKLSTRHAADFEALAEADKEVFNATMTAHGIAPEAFQERGRLSTIMRTYLAAKRVLQTQERVRSIQPIRHMRPGLFTTAGRGAPAIPPFDFRMHLVAGGNPGAYAVIAHMGYENILSSYFYIADLAKMSVHKSTYAQLESYVADPRKFSSTTQPVADYYSMLKEHLHEK